jgi:putative SOS response-associated peptidase YedK
MCGRFTLKSSVAIMAEYFRAAGIPTFSPRYNIAPTQAVLCVRQDERGERRWATYRWGLVPMA